jgi:hypothetical protein
MGVETREAMQWLGEHSRADSVVLAGPETGNALPAFASVRVLYGHPFETPDAESMRQLVVGLFQGDIDFGPGVDLIKGRTIDIVFYGPEERRLGSPPWLAELPPLYVNDSVTIFQVPTP